MEQTTPLKCSCAHCGQIIEYEPAKVGQTVECPKCSEKSQLPPPPEIPEATATCLNCGAPLKPGDLVCRECETRRRRKRATLIRISVFSISALAIAAALFLVRQRPRPSSASPAADTVTPLPQPKVKTIKSLNDLKAGKFALSRTSGSDANLISGDIENLSENVHHRVKVELDVLDAQGEKIGTVSDFITELPPHGVWHVMARTSDPKVVSVRFNALSEEP